MFIEAFLRHRATIVFAALAFGFFSSAARFLPSWLFNAVWGVAVGGMLTAAVLLALDSRQMARREAKAQEEINESIKLWMAELERNSKRDESNRLN